MFGCVGLGDFGAEAVNRVPHSRTHSRSRAFKREMSAKMAIQDENWEEAEQYLLEAIKVEPENAEIMVQIGYHVHARKKEWKQMNEMFNAAVSINPEAKTLGRPVKEVTKNYREMYWGFGLSIAFVMQR